MTDKLKFTDRETLTFSTGRTITPNCRIIGINDELDIYEGYDSCIFPHPYSEKLSEIEKIELADFMIKLWTAYKIK